MCFHQEPSSLQLCYDPAGSTRMAAYHGTTCLSFIYDGGIVVAVDSRATGGSFIFSGTVMKILDIAPNMVGTMAGGAADCQYWLRNLSHSRSFCTNSAINNH
ncbi:20S proteasome subunit beta 5 [Histomonas meleagridis]|nr:20S proteasome subunit beta 5 [Histomonas meleagridis]